MFLPLVKLKVMKKISLLLFTALSILNHSQLYSSLLKNASWTIVKIQWNGTDYYPPDPLKMSGIVKFSINNTFESTFFNSAAGNATFGDSNANYFSLQNIAVTLAEYSGENQQAIRQFDAMTTGFYFGYQSTEKFYFDYQEIFSGKNLTVTNPLGYKIFYSNLLLANNEASLYKEVSIYPNPAKNEFVIKSSTNIIGKLNVEIYESSGKLVSSQNISSNDAISTQALQNGTYLVKISGSRLKYSSKLIVKK